MNKRDYNTDCKTILFLAEAGRVVMTGNWKSWLSTKGGLIQGGA